MQSLMSQFAHPTGVLGSLAGWLLLVRNQERNRWTLKLLDLHPAHQALEIGFGPGWAIEQAAGILTLGHLSGVDSSATMLKDASARNAKSIEAGRVSLRAGTEYPLPFPNATLDRVFAVNSFQFWSDPMQGLREVKRVLKPKGRAAITVQPMWVNTDDEARTVGKQLQIQLVEAGFQSVTLETLPLKPLCFCALGIA